MNTLSKFNYNSRPLDTTEIPINHFAPMLLPRRLNNNQGTVSN
jgi:hypothetical protein